MIAPRRAIPGAQLAIVPGANHFLPYTMPYKVLATALPFLDGVKPATMPADSRWILGRRLDLLGPVSRSSSPGGILHQL